LILWIFNNLSTKFTFGYNRTKTAHFTSTSTNIRDDLGVGEISIGDLNITQRHKAAICKPCN